MNRNYISVTNSPRLLSYVSNLHVCVTNILPSQAARAEIDTEVLHIISNRQLTSASLPWRRSQHRSIDYVGQKINSMAQSP
jgi:hypothetical protein